MAKVGRFVIDPKAGSYCRITLDRGDRRFWSVTTRGGVRSGSVTIEEVRWWGFVPGATVFACDLEQRGRPAAVGPSRRRRASGQCPGHATRGPGRACQALPVTERGEGHMRGPGFFGTSTRIAGQCRRDVGTGRGGVLLVLAIPGMAFAGGRRPGLLQILFGLALLMVGAKVGGLAGRTVGTARRARSVPGRHRRGEPAATLLW